MAVENGFGSGFYFGFCFDEGACWAVDVPERLRDAGDPLVDSRLFGPGLRSSLDETDAHARRKGRLMSGWTKFKLSPTATGENEDSDIRRTWQYEVSICRLFASCMLFWALQNAKISTYFWFIIFMQRRGSNLFFALHPLSVRSADAR